MEEDMVKKKLKAQYDLVKPLYESMCQEIIKQLQTLLNDNGIKLAVPLDYRVKEWDSSIAKIERYSINIDEVSIV